jgi:outer membrane protein
MSPARKILPLVLGLAGMTGVQADFVGLNIGAYAWNPDIAGSMHTGSDSKIELDSDLGFKDESGSGLSVSLEHPMPALPNVRYQTVDLKSSSRSTISSDIRFNGNTYSAAETINSTLDLSHQEIVLYYEMLDNWINLDLGIDLKMFDGEAGINDNRVTIDETIPMLYLSARVDLPFTGFYVGANIQQLSLGDNSAEDTTLLIGYESNLGLGIEGGFKTFNLDLNDANNLDTNLEYDGLFLNGYFHF